MLQLHQRVERRARRLTPDTIPKSFAFQLQCHHQGKKLGDALNRKRHQSVAHTEDFTRHRHHGHAKTVSGHLGQLRNVGRNLPLPDHRFNHLQDLGQYPFVVHISLGN